MMNTRLTLALTVLAALPFSVAVACGGEDTPTDESGGSGGADATGGRPATGGRSSGGSPSGGTASGGGTPGTGGDMGGAGTGGAGTGGAGTGGDMGGMAGMGGMGGMGGDAGLPSIADSCTAVCETLAGIDCAAHDGYGDCQAGCETDTGYLGYYYPDACQTEYQTYVDCLAGVTGDEWVCDGTSFWMGVLIPVGHECLASQTAYADCDFSYYCMANPTGDGCQ